MCSSTGCEHIVQNNKFISAIYVLFQFWNSLYIFIILNLKRENRQIKVKNTKQYNEWVENLKGQGSRSDCRIKLTLLAPNTLRL